MPSELTKAEIAAMSEEEKADYFRNRPERRVYGRAKGRPLRKNQQELVADMLPRLEIALPFKPEEEERPSPEKSRAWLDSLFVEPDFGPPDGAGQLEETWLEVGFGGGEHLAWQAEANPHVAFIGCEPFINGSGSLFSKLDEQGARNVRIFRDDARFLVQSLPEASIDRMFLLFPDPWPKKRHWRRRFIQPDTVNEVARILKPGAEFRVASDDMSVLRWMLWHISSHPAFDWQARRPADWRNRPDDWPGTRYEAKGIRAGRTPVFLRFTRKTITD